MKNDRRKGGETITDEHRELLNPHQRMTVGELEMLGWSLKFVRRPLFNHPVPVVLNEKNGEIGIIDEDGKITLAPPGSVREDNEHTEATQEAGTTQEWDEKRKGEPPVPKQIGMHLNDSQLLSLRQIENFGWELKFIRRPLFQDSIAVIINEDGSKLAAIEADGRIELNSGLPLREETSEAPSREETVIVQSKKKQAR